MPDSTERDRGFDALRERMTADELAPLRDAWERLAQDDADRPGEHVRGRFERWLDGLQAAGDAAGRRRQQALAVAFAAGLVIGLALAIWTGRGTGAPPDARTAELIARLASPSSTAVGRLAAVEHLDRLPARDALPARLLYEIARRDTNHDVRLAALESLLARGGQLADDATEAVAWERLDSSLEQLAWIELVITNGNPRAMPALDRFVRSRQSLALLDPLVAERAHYALLQLRNGRI